MKSEKINIVYFGNEESSLVSFLKNQGHEVTIFKDKVTLSQLMQINPGFLISYGYRHVISKDIVEHFDGRLINLHISYLPWNRGADPNFWSHVEDSPKGVTIHHMDQGLDTGDIIVQKLVQFDEEDTLRTSYAKLKIEIENLFFDYWEKIWNGQSPRLSQDKEAGSFHKMKDKMQFHLPENFHDWKLSEIKARLKRADE